MRRSKSTAKDGSRNRGKAWEATLDAWHASYLTQGRAYVAKTPPAVKIIRMQDQGRFTACFAGAGPPDYQGAVLGTPIAFDAKQSATEVFHFDKLPDHQATAFDALEAHGGLAFVALRTPLSAWCLWWSDIGPMWWRWRREGGRPASLKVEVGRPDLFGLPYSRMPAIGWCNVVADRIRARP